jgi:4a-hydroxytetrahydrobiopterin dehydratase
MALLNDEQVQARLGELQGWDVAGGALHKDFKLDDFKGSVDFVNRLTPVAEEMNHHPDLAISWNTVTVTITTHSEGGLTENDFELAKKIDTLGA